MIDVTCWEIKKPKLWGIIPVVYTYPSDSAEGHHLAYAVPIDMGLPPRRFGQGAPDSKSGSGVASSIDVSIVGELGLCESRRVEHRVVCRRCARSETIQPDTRRLRSADAWYHALHW